MVVGNGMIAKALARFKLDSTVTMFASGVSNSNEQDQGAYLREKELLKPFLQRPEKLIYFSTSSIYDLSLQSSAYVQHKLEMEQWIATTASQYLLVRLPNVVGNTGNPNTIFNAFKNKLQHNEEIQVHSKACRYLLDADDLADLLHMLIHDNAALNKTINLCYNNCIGIPKLIQLMEKEMRIPARIKAVDKGSCYKVDNSLMAEIFKRSGKKIPGQEVNRELVRKYLV